MAAADIVDTAGTGQKFELELAAVAAVAAGHIVLGHILEDRFEVRH